MPWQVIGLIGVLLLVSAVVGGGVSITGAGSMPAFVGFKRSIAVALAGVLVLGMAYVTWRDAPVAQQAQTTGLSGWLNPIMHKLDTFTRELDVESSRTDLTLRPASGELGAPIRATASGFLPHEKVDLRLGTIVLRTVPANRHGKINIKLRIEDSEWCSSGQCQIIVEGKNSLKWTTATYQLTAHQAIASHASSAGAGGHGPAGCSIETTPVTQLHQTQDPVAAGERMLVGTYHVVKIGEQSWAGSEIQWFETDVAGRVGWVRDDPAEVASRSASCP
jgi:hypothetical protein